MTGEQPSTHVDYVAKVRHILDAVKPSAEDRTAQVEAWNEYGRHGALWQLVHRRPRESR